MNLLARFLISMMIMGSGIAFFPSSGNSSSILGVSNYIQSLTTQGDYIWCATENGVTRWNRLDGTNVTYTEEDGIPHPCVRGIDLDSRGTLWIGTSLMGPSIEVVKFDGISWNKIDTGPPSPEFHTWDVTDTWEMAEDKDGVLWFATYTGVVSYDGVSWKTYTTKDGLSSTWVFTVAVDEENVKWFGMQGEGGVTSFDGTMWKTYSKNDGLSHNNVRSIVIDRNNVKWFGTDYGLTRFDGNTWTTYHTEDGLLDNVVLSLAVDHDNMLWIGGLSGVTRYDGNTWTRCSEGIRAQFHDIAVDDQNVKWFGTDNGLFRFDGTTWIKYINSGGLADDDVDVIAVDKNNVKWLGTDYGVSRYDGNNWSLYTNENGLVNREVHSIAVDTDNVKWFGTNGGVSAFDEYRWTSYTAENSGLSSNVVKSIAVDKKNVKWIGTIEGMSCFDGNNWYNIYQENGQPLAWICSIVVDNNDVKWFNGADKIIRFDGVTWKYYSKENSGFPGDTVTSLYVDDNNILWAGYMIKDAPDVSRAGGVCSFDGSRWSIYTMEDGLVYYNVNAITKDFEGNVWIGTIHGLSRFDGATWKSFNAPEILPHQCVNTIAVDHNNVKWFGTGYGVLLFDRGVWKSASGHVISSVNQPRDKPVEFTLDNYPNPFNPSTTIEFTLPSSGKSNLVICDIMGRKVRELISGQVSAGKRTVLWDGRDDSGLPVSSGIYFARHTMGKYTAARKMLLIK